YTRFQLGIICSVIVRITLSTSNVFYQSHTFNQTSGTNQIPCTATGEALYNAILDERRLEFALEGYRTWDLIRTGRLIERVGLVKDIARTQGNTNYNTTNDAQLEPRVAGIRNNIIKSSILGKEGKHIPVFPLPETEVSFWNLEANPF
ncbi:hypothetical protein EZS27_035393, partial [termite gut metagenome]